MTARAQKDQAAAASVRSFLVADIRGYTAYTAAHGDEAAARLVEHFAALVSDGVTAWSGTLVELRGDEALAAFESPRAALRAAVELQTAFADETNTGSARPLHVGIGLDAGEAVPVADGYRGAALNRAARLCSAAGAGETLASEELIHLAGPMADVEYAAPREVDAKGLEAPVVVVLVSATDVAVPELGPAVTLPKPAPVPPQLDPIVPLAGRHDELAWLRWHWHRARFGHARSVVVSGVPGIGKTRLAAALASIAHEDGARITYLPMATGVTEAVLATQADGQPTLLVVDDIDAARRELVSATVEEAAALEGSVLLLVTHRTEASAELLKSLEELTPRLLRRELGPLDLAAVRMIASLYAGDAVDQLPLSDIAEESDGNPASIHRLSHEWARRLATQRVGASAGRAESGRRDLREAEAALLADIALLGQAREGGQRYGDRPDLTAGDARKGARTGACPYKGLEPYDAVDADLFYGRERLVAEFTARLVGSPFLAIVGASGSGKSSAIAAGLLPSLAGGALPGSENWAQITMRPGERPLTALTRALCRGFEGLCEGERDAAALLDAALATLPKGARLVLFIDQFEEVFASPDATERSAFIDAVCGDHPGLLVIVALRADHYGAAAAYPALARLLASHHVLVGTLTRSELVSVIERPAEHVGLQVEPDLVDALVADAGTEPSVLPLLSTALLEAWTLRDGDRLTLAAYVAGGGLHGAVARLAEGVWTSLEPDRQAAARTILLRLAGSGEAGDHVRRRVLLAEFDLDDDPTAADVLERLVAARLLTIDDDTLEVTHEALLREWPRLRAWLEDDASGHQLHLHLAAAAGEWDADGRPAGDLYRGARLSAALDWSAEHPKQLNTVERDFLEASWTANEAAAARQRRMNRRLRLLVAGIGVLLVAAIGAGIVASLQARRADDERLAASAGELAMAANAELDFDPGLSKLLALEAGRVDPNPGVLASLHTALAADAIDQRVPLMHAETGMSMPNLDPGGRWVVLSGTKPRPRSQLEVLDLPSDATEPVWTYEAPPGAFISVPRFTPDGTRLVAGLFAIEGDTPDSPARPEGLGIAVWQAPPDGTSEWELVDLIDVGPCGARIEDVSNRNVLIDVPPDPEDGCFPRGAPTNRASIELVGLDDHVARPVTDTFAMAGPRDLLSEDGQRVVFSNDEDPPQTIVADTDTMSVRWSADRDLWWPLAIDTDGSRVLVENPTFGLEVWDVDQGEVISTHFHPGGIGRGQFHPSQDLILSTGFDGTPALWDPRNGRDVATFPAAGSLWPQFFGDRLGVIQDSAAALNIIDPRPQGEPLALDLCEDTESRQVSAVQDRDFDAVNGKLVFTLDCETPYWLGQSPTVVVDASTGDIELSVDGHTGWQHAVSPDGRLIARQDMPTGGGIAIRDLESGEVRSNLDLVCLHGVEPDPETGCGDDEFEFVTQWMDWSSDGRFIAAGSDGHVVVWDAVSGEVLTMIIPGDDDSFVAWDSTISPDGRHLIVFRIESINSDAQTNWLDVYSTETWELERSAEIDTGSPAPGMDFAGWAPDGSTLYGRGGSAAGSSNSTLVWIDAETLERQGPTIRLHDDTTMHDALSPDGTRLATTSASGEIRIWDLSERTLAHEIQLRFMHPNELAVGVAWTDDSRIAVVTEAGLLIEFTTDADELMDLVTESLTRGFTAGECARFEIYPCPTLEEMREG